MNESLCNKRVNIRTTAKADSSTPCLSKILVGDENHVIIRIKLFELVILVSAAAQVHGIAEVELT